MKIQLVWLMVVIFTLFSNGYAELSIQEENLTYREELITFINEQEQELLDSAREIFEHRLPEYASEPFTSENMFARVFIRHTDYTPLDTITGAVLTGITADYEGLYVYIESEDSLTTYDMPTTELLLESGMIEYIDVYESGNISFYTTYTNGSWGTGLYYQILYVQNGEQPSEDYGWQAVDGGWYRISDGNSRYVSQVTEYLYYEFTKY